MSKLGDKLGMLAAQMFLPMLVGLGKDEAHDALIKLANEKPKKFGVLIQSVYPTFKGVLQPFVHSTKTKLDDAVADPMVTLLEEIMTELNIPIPDVTPIDFTAPDEEVPEVTETPVV